jgi:hypothetical protein
MILRSTYKPDTYYCNYSELPPRVQERLQDARRLSVERSHYTVYEHMAFLRLRRVRIDGGVYDLELTLGSCDIRHSDHTWSDKYECYIDEDTNEVDETKYAEQTARELYECAELTGYDVYLTEV